MGPFWGWVDSQRDEAAFFDLEVEPRDVFEEVKIDLKGAEVAKRLDYRGDIVCEGPVG